MSAPGTWLIWSNEHRMWWAPNSCGYTSSIDKAGRYSLAEAVMRSETRSPGEVPPEVVVPSPELVAQMLERPGTRA